MNRTASPIISFGASLIAIAALAFDGGLRSVIALLACLATAVGVVWVTHSKTQHPGDRCMHTLFDRSSDIVVVVNNADIVVLSNPAAERLANRSPGDWDLLDAVYEPDAAALTAFVDTARSARTSSSRSANQSDRLQCRLVGRNGSPEWFEATATDLRSEPGVSGMVVSFRNISEHKQLEHDIAHRVLFDDLTGIGNKILLNQRIEHALSRRSIGTGVAGLLVIDLDDFSEINVALGYAVGDELLKVVAFRIDQFVRRHDTVARLAEDEFAVLVEDTDGERAENIATRLLNAIQDPLVFEGRDVKVSASIGIAVAGQTDEAVVLLRNAGVAMRHSKSSGKGCISVFDQSMYTSTHASMHAKAGKS